MNWKVHSLCFAIFKQGIIMVQWGTNLQTEDAFHGQLGNTKQVFECVDINMK